MRGGVARWKRGVAGQGVRQAIAYAFGGVCDSTLTAKTAAGVLAAADYADPLMVRYIVEEGSIRDDLLSRRQLRTWVDGGDPLTGEHRGFEMVSPAADLVLDATINAPKSFSIAAMLHPELKFAYEDLQDRLRDRIITLWQQDLNARRGPAGCIREGLSRIEVVELKHERSRSLDPHKHRHLWLNIKVQGQDGRWSNVDSRVALRFQTVVNAEGDLAARTDPAWVNALASHGYSLNADGEITELAHLVRPLSRRSNQIEANKAVRTKWWKDSHPGQEPDHDVLNAIDRWAWATGRPNKPHHVDDHDWGDEVRAEIVRIDPTCVSQNREPAHIQMEDSTVDRELLAARAIVDADQRSTGTGGRFSVFDVRAGVLRSIAASGVVAERDSVNQLVTALTETAIIAHTVNLLDGAESPQHVKGLMATSTAVAKVSLSRQLEALPDTGHGLADAEIDRIARVIEPDRTLDSDQMLGAAAIAGTQTLVTISGAAGAGKTTMLKVASVALRRQGRQMIIVAPTKKASSVAGRETSSAASSLHQLLHDYGWRWNPDPAGRTVWAQLQIGETDPVSGIIYRGPRHTRLRPGDRIIVDEAGMLDLDAANALVLLARQTKVGLAVVGDKYQAMPVGHSGAMAVIARNSAAIVELTNVHRFQDADWAELTLLLRGVQGRDAMTRVADRLIATNHVKLTPNTETAHDVMVDGWFEALGRRQTIALVTATHAEARAVSEAIQQRRINSGAIETKRATFGQEGQAIYEGDVVQTRRNDPFAGVENRQVWKVRRIGRDEILLESTTDPCDRRRINHDYAARSLHLGYATTVHGIQGETTDRSIVGPGVDAAGLYVGLTRGRDDNLVVLISSSPGAARDELVEMMHRGALEDSVEASRLAARDELNRSARQDPSVHTTGHERSSTRNLT